MPKSVIIVALSAMLLTLMLSGCTDDPAPTTAPVATPTTAPTNTPTLEPTATPTSAPTTDTPDQASGGGVLGLDIDIETTWQQMFDTFATQEQNCIRDSIDSNTLDALLTESFMEDDSTTLTEEQRVQFLSCLNEETSGDLFIAILVAEAEGTEVGETSIACMQELMEGVNIVALFAAEGSSPEAEEFVVLVLGLTACIEDTSTGRARRRFRERHFYIAGRGRPRLPGLGRQGRLRIPC